MSALAEMYVQGVSTRKVKGRDGRTVRAHVLGEHRQPDQQEPGWTAPALCPTAGSTRRIPI